MSREILVLMKIVGLRKLFGITGKRVIIHVVGELYLKRRLF